MVDVMVVRWLRSVTVDTESSRVVAIDSAAQSVAHEVSGYDVLQLVESTYLGSENASQAALLEAVRAEDPTFAPSADDLEARLTSAVALYHILGQHQELSAAACHAILSAEWQGWTAPVPELELLATTTLGARSEASRKRPEEVSSVSAAAALKKRPALPADGTAMSAEHGQGLIDFVVASVNAATRSADAATRQLTQQLRASDEELNLLWWAFSGYNAILERQVPGMSNAGQAAIAVGLEFAALLKFDEEPLSTKAILEGLLARKTNKHITLKAAVEATPPSVTGLPSGHSPQQLLPVLSSLREASAFGHKPAWVDSALRYGIDTTGEHGAVSLAEQVVRECLIVRAMTT